jgi:hypothetical protein
VCCLLVLNSVTSTPQWIALDNAMAHEHAERAQAQADEAAIKATQDASGAQHQLHELTLQKSQLESIRCNSGELCHRAVVSRRRVGHI